MERLGRRAVTFIREKDIEWSLFHVETVKYGCDLIWIAVVGFQDERALAFLVHATRGLFRALLVRPVVDRYVDSRCRECQRDALTDAAAGARHQSVLTFQPDLHESSDLPQRVPDGMSF